MQIVASSFIFKQLLYFKLSIEHLFVSVLVHILDSREHNKTEQRLAPPTSYQPRP